MVSEWRETTLGDVIELKRGYDLPQKERKPGNVPLVSSSGVSDKHSVAMVKGPGVVTGRYGTIGKVFFVEEDFWPLNTTLYVRDFKGNDPRFISYFLRGINFHAYTDKAAVPGVNRNDLHLAEVVFPNDVGEQRAIAETLGALDDHIDNLRQTNATLEAIAAALFKSWFVDFDGVAPEDMQESELGLIPKDWRVVAFGDIATQGKGSVNPMNAPEQVFTHYSLPAFDASQIPVQELGDTIKSNKTPVPDDSVLVSKLNPHIPRIWLVGEAGYNAVCSTEFIVWTPKQPANSAFMYCLASSREFNHSMRQFVTGTSNSHQRVKPEQIADIRVIAANDEAIAKFSEGS